jgi:hypothetical protein
MANCPAKDLYFVHIPKNAGSSIEEVGLDHGVKWGKEFFNRKLYKFFLNGKLVSLAHWHLPYEVRKYDRAPDKCFCVVRNPYEKIVSSYNYHSRNFSQIQKLTLNEYIDEALKSFFVNEFKLDNHQRPQSEYIFHKGEKVINNILRFENISEDFKKLTGLELSKKVNSSPVGSCTIEDISDKNIHLINYFYHEDFENFGYERIIRH